MLQLGNQQVNALFLLFWRDFSAGYSEEYFFNRLLNKTIKIYRRSITDITKRILLTRYLES
jgi:uncharacterized protein (DUF2164 family)